jgi:hypothetical protein
VHRHLLAFVVENDEHMKAPCSPVVIAPAVQLIVPISVLAKKDENLSESQLYFLHLLTTRVLRSGKSPMHYYPLKLVLLEKQLGSKPRERQIQPLVDIGYVIVQLNKEGAETYEAGVRPKSYRLSDDLIKEVLSQRIKAFYSKAGSPLSKRLLTLRIEQRKEAVVHTSTLSKEYEWICGLQFDVNRAREFQFQFEQTGRRGTKKYTREASLRLESDIQVLSHLRSGEFTFNYNGIRLTTSVANAMREMRKCLMDDKGNYFIELDLKSSQLVFLCKALYHVYSEGITRDYKGQLLKLRKVPVDFSMLDGVVPSDVKAFIHHVIHGDIYRELQIMEQEYSTTWRQLDDGVFLKEIAIPNVKRYPESRADFKVKVMKEVLFNFQTRKHNFSKLALAFKESYPSVQNVLEEIASECTGPKKSKDISVITQSYEAYFFHSLTLKALIDEFPGRLLYVVHDGIGVPSDLSVSIHESICVKLREFLGIQNDHLLRV